MRRLDSQRQTHHQTGYYCQTHTFTLRRVARERGRSPRCLQEKWEDTYRLPSLAGRTYVGLAERGRRQVEEPLLGLDQIGLDSYVNPDFFKCRSGMTK